MLSDSHDKFMTSPAGEVAFSVNLCPSLSSTPCRTVIDPRTFTGSSEATQKKHGYAVSPDDLRKVQSLRHSLGHSSLRGTTSKRAVWTTQRTSRLFELLTRPALLFTPSLGIRLPFDLAGLEGGVGRPKLNTANSSLPIRKRNQPIDPDPCLLSVDGLLDCLCVMSNLVDQVYYDCKESDEHHTSVDDADDIEHTPTLVAANYFRKRVKPALSRLADLRVKLSDFRLGKFIGRGACGVVRIVHEIAPPGSVYAMKSQYKGAWLHHDPEGAQLMLERTVLAQAAAIENPWLPHLHYAFQDDKYLHLVMDYEPGGDLYIFLSKVGHLLDADMIAFYAAEAVEAIHSLHKMGYIHCDLKPENFAIERSGHLKLLDFGSAIRLDADGKCICPTMVGTKEYLNIELLRQRGRHNEEPLLVGPEYDYWAIGVLLYEMFYSRTPFFDDNEDTMMQKIVDYKRTLKFPADVCIPDDAVRLIRSLITSPSKRLIYDGVIQHPFFKCVDFATLRQTTPPYLPPVGDLDDVSNFSGGGARTRDEAIMDVSTNHTFSPARVKESFPGSFYPTDIEPESNIANQADDTILPSVPTKPSFYEMNDENADPNSLQTAPQPLPEREAKVKAIQEAAAIPVHEEIEEIDDIEWEGADCVRNLPFVGYTFTPGLVLLRKLTTGQAAAVTAAGLGTTLTNNNNTVTVSLSPSRPSLLPARAHVEGASRPQIQPIVEDCPSSTVPSQWLEKLGELRTLHSKLERQVLTLDPDYVDMAKFQVVQQQLVNAIEDSSNLVSFGEAIQVLFTSILNCERRTLEHLSNQIGRLQEENRQLQLASNENLIHRTTVDKVRLVLSRLDALPDDFVEADLLELMQATCSDRVKYEGETDGSASDNEPLIQQLFLLIHKHLKRTMARETAHRIAMESASRELKEAWEASKQQMGTLDSIIADQRHLRECENRLNREIQELNQKLADSKQCQRDLRNRCVVYEDKYFAACDVIKEEKLLNERLQTEIENSKTQIRRHQVDEEAAQHRETVLRDQLAECERLLSNSRHEVSLLRDRYERLKEATADMEASLLNRDNRTVMTALNRELTSARDEVETLKNEASQLHSQIDRLRMNNTQLVSQRDDAVQQVRELTAALAQERELGEVTQHASENEIFRLTTITKQQGKLIDHMCGLLPPEHQPLRRLSDGRYDLTQVPSQLHNKRSTVKLLGHRAFKTVKTRKSGGSQSDPSGHSGSGSHLIAAASALFARRRADIKVGTDKDTRHPNAQVFVKQPSRLQRIVKKSGLRFKRRTLVSPRQQATTESDQALTEEDEINTVDPGGTLTFYSSDSANDSDDYCRGLPIPVPHAPQELLDVNSDCLSISSFSSGPSTTSSAPSAPVHCTDTKSSSWRRFRSKARVGWADAHSDKRVASSQPKMLKQISKILGKGKALSSNTGSSGRHH